MKNRAAGREWRIAILSAATLVFAIAPWTAFAWDWNYYIWPLALAAVALTAASAVGRSLSVPRTIVLLAQLIVAFEVVLVSIVGRWWPGEGAWGIFSERLSAAVTIAREYAAPVPHGVTGLAPLMMLLGVAVIVVFDLVAGTMRRPGLGGLLILAVLTTTGALLDEPLNWGTFVFGAISFGALLAAVREADLLAWSSLRRGDKEAGGQVAEAFNTRVASLRIGVTAAALAVIAPLFIPMVGSGTFSALKTNNGGSGGAAGVGLSKPFLDMKKNLVQSKAIPLVRISSLKRPSYFRIAVLDYFDGKDWTQGPRDFAQLTSKTRPPGLSNSALSGEVLTYQVTTMAAYDATTLPVPYPPGTLQSQARSVGGGATAMFVDPGTWEVEASGAGGMASNYQFTVSQSQQVIDPAALSKAPEAPAGIQQRYTELPADLPSWVQATATKVTSGATSKFEAAQLLQEWFRSAGGFSYSLESGSGSGLEQLHRFVSDNPADRVGYCEQFSTAMVLFGRELGIPSRVVVGFLNPEASTLGGWQFSTKDLHAWPEMYFPGAGWVRFEPTPAARTGDAPAYTALNSNVQPPPVGPSASRSLRPTPTQSPTTGPSTAGRSSAIWPLAPALWWLLAIVVLGVFGGLPRTAAWALRRWRWRRASTPAARAEAAWREVVDLAEDLGYQPSEPTPTLRRTATELSREVTMTDPVAGPPTAAALSRLALEVEAARYSSHYSGLGTVEADLDKSRKGLDASAGPYRRRRATWWPLAAFRRR